MTRQDVPPSRAVAPGAPAAEARTRAALPRMAAAMFAACLSASPVSTLLAQPAPVPKSNPMKVYAHYMPWFQTPYTLGGSNWGWHWKMNTRNPNIIDGNGRRQIASHYYPLTGPYDSSDPDIIEYHMNLMRVSGIDGVIIDWYGTAGTNGDIGSLLSASNTIISKTGNHGMKFAVCLEDRFAASTNDVKTNINYARNNYFNNPQYIRVGTGNAPFMPIFGPVQFHQPSQWSSILSGGGEQPALLPLWYQSAEVGTPAQGEYSWIYEDAGQDNHYSHQQNFLTTRSQSLDIVMGSAYPGFNDYYQEGGAGSTILDIPHNNGQTLSSLLALNSTYSANMDMLQLNTFNDFGEGTIFEPTVETGFSYLQQVQQYTGVTYGLAELELAFSLHDARKDFAGNPTAQAQLNQVASLFTQLDFAGARLALDAVSVPRWALAGGGNWHTPASWGGALPNGTNTTVVFGPAVTAASTVTNDVATTVGTITFDNLNRYTLSGAGSLTMRVSGTSAGINVLRGSHRIAQALSIASDTVLSAAPGATLTIASPVTIQTGKRLTENAGSGLVQYESSVDVLSAGGFATRSSSHMTRLTLAGTATATLQLGSAAAAQHIDTVMLGGGAVLDLTASDLVTGTAKATIEALVRNARGSGEWTTPGITSSTARDNGSHSTTLGVLSGAEYSAAGGTGVFSGRTYVAADTLVKYTWYGDADLSGGIDFDDYVRIDGGFNAGLSGWLNGDFDYSGSIDFDDYVLIDLAFNAQNGTLRRATDYIDGTDRSLAGMSDPALKKVLTHFAKFGVDYGTHFLAAVPEPWVLGPLGCLTLLALGRRRSHCA